MAEVKYKWGEWKKVNLTDYPFNILPDESTSCSESKEAEVERVKENYIIVRDNKILSGILSATFEGNDFEYFDSETDPTPRLPGELKIYCPIDEHDSEFWPSSVGNTVERPYDWDSWFYLNFNSLGYGIVTGLKNRRISKGPYFMLEFEGLSPIFIRPIAE